MLISLACDNRKFLGLSRRLDRLQRVRCARRFSGRERRRPHGGGQHRPMAVCAEFRQRASRCQIARHLDGGWLPMPVMTATDKNVAYQQTTFVAPVGEAPAGKPAWLREQALGVGGIRREKHWNRARGRADCVPIRRRSKIPAIRFNTEKSMRAIWPTSGRSPVGVHRHSWRELSLSWKLEPTGVVVSGELPAGGKVAFSVYLPAWKLAADDYRVLREGRSPGHPRVEKLLEEAARTGHADRHSRRVSRQISFEPRR